jgi:molecular chaperone Hsp33
MTTTDRIIRATGKRTPMRLVLADITHTMNQIGAKHKASAYSLKLLAETAVGSLLLSSSLKFPGTVSLKISFSGDFSFVQADTTPQGLIRAMIPQEEILKNKNFEPVLLHQKIEVIKLNEKGKRLQESIVQAAGNSVGRNIAVYLLQSEQTRSAVGIEAQINEQDPSKLDYAVGFLLEAYPDLEEESLSILEDTIVNLPPFVQMFNFEKSSFELNTLLKELAGPYDVEVVKEQVPMFYCPCNQVRTIASLSSLSDSDLKDLVRDGADLEIICDFCREKYVVHPKDITDILKNRGL